VKWLAILVLFLKQGFLQATNPSAFFTAAWLGAIVLATKRKFPQ